MSAPRPDPCPPQGAATPRRRGRSKGPYVHNAQINAARIDAVAEDMAKAANRKELALAMYRVGARPNDIAKATGYSAHSIHAIAKAVGVKRLVHPPHGRPPAAPAPKVGSGKILRSQACSDPAAGRAQAESARAWLVEISEGRQKARNRFELALAMFLQGKAVPEIAQATNYAPRTISEQARSYGLAAPVRRAPGRNRAEAEGWIGLGDEAGLRPVNPNRLYGSKAVLPPPLSRAKLSEINFKGSS